MHQRRSRSLAYIGRIDYKKGGKRKNKALAVGWIVSLFLISLVSVTAEAMSVSAEQNQRGGDFLGNLTEEDIEKIKIFEEAYVVSSLEAFESDNKACGFIATNTQKICEEQEIDVDFIMTTMHIIPVIETSRGFYGVQGYALYKFTSYYRNWPERAVYDGADYKADSSGRAVLTNRKIKTHAPVFIDCIWDERIEKYDKWIINKSLVKIGKTIALERETRMGARAYG